MAIFVKWRPSWTPPWILQCSRVTKVDPADSKNGPRGLNITIEKKLDWHFPVSTPISAGLVKCVLVGKMVGLYVYTLIAVLVTTSYIFIYFSLLTYWTTVFSSISTIFFFVYISCKLLQQRLLIINLFVDCGWSRISAAPLF